MTERESKNIVLLFLVLFFGFAAATIFWPKRSYSETENRTLAAFPKASAETIFNGKFESGYEEYLTDQFVLRDIWIGIKTNTERLMGHQDSKDVYFADHDYLIEKHTGTFTSDQAEGNIGTLSAFVSRYGAQFDGHMTVMVVPNAVKLLSDYLPPFAAPYDEALYLEKISGSLPAGVWFDCLPSLEGHEKEDLYYRTDHHWKTGAAFAVYRDWMKQKGRPEPSLSDYTVETVTDSFLGTIQSRLGIKARPDSIQVYHDTHEPAYTVSRTSTDVTKDTLYDYSYLKTKDKYALFFGGNEGLIRVKTNVNNGQRLLVIKDSYANCFVPFLLPGYEGIDLLDVRYYNQKVSELIAAGNYTDVLFLFNAAGFAEESALARLHL